MSLDYLNDIAIDTDVYDHWPEVINDCWAAYFPGSALAPASMAIINTSAHSARTVVEIESDRPISDGNIARLIFSFSDRENDNRAFIHGVFVEDDFRLQGVATFLVVLTRTWVAQTLGKSIVAITGSASPDALGIIAKIHSTYGIAESEYVNAP